MSTTRLRMTVGQLDLVASGGAARRERMLRRLAGADLFELTNELFWGDVTVLIGDADFGGRCYALDTVWGWFVAGRELATSSKYRFAAADGVGDYTFRRPDDKVKVSMDRGPIGVVALLELRTVTADTCRGTIRSLVAAYPALAGNAALKDVVRQLAYQQAVRCLTCSANRRRFVVNALLIPYLLVLQREIF